MPIPVEVFLLIAVRWPVIANAAGSLALQPPCSAVAQEWRVHGKIVSRNPD